jgi:hypothetical protein
MHHLSIGAIRADALFVSALQRGDHPMLTECLDSRGNGLPDFLGTRSPRLATWLYSDIASTPRAWPSLRMDSDPMPCSPA